MSAERLPENPQHPPSGAAPLRVAANDTGSAVEKYTKFHLAIDRGTRQQKEAEEGDLVAKFTDAHTANVRILEIHDFTVGEFLYYLQRVGQAYGWDRREKYQPENLRELEVMLKNRQARLFVFQMGGQDIGFCLTANIDARFETHTHPSAKNGMKKTTAIEVFKRQARLKRDDTAVEIYKFGLFPEFTNKGLGHYPLEKMLDILMEHGDRFDIVYLDTRDTNHQGVRSFYAKHGINVFHAEKLESDVIATAPVWEAPKTNPGRVQPVMNGGGTPPAPGGGNASANDGTSDAPAPR